MSDVAVVGNLARDRVDGGPDRPGGGPFFAALALQLLDRGAQILARCADADLPLLDRSLQALGVPPVTVISAQHTASFDHRYDGELRTTHVTGIGDPWSPADAARLAPSVRWVHVAPLARSDFPPDTLAALAENGRRLSLDGQGLVRVPRVGPLTEDAAFERALLGSVTVLKLSEEEARIVAGGGFDAAAARALGVPEIIVTLGSRGEVVWLDGVETHVPTAPVHGVETTGAGDAFMVGYVTARSDGASPVDAARRGSELVGRMLAARRDGA